MKKNIKNPNDDLQTIREMMERSSKFLSLSGLAGIFAGVCALIGATVAWFFILGPEQLTYNDFIRNEGDLTASLTGYYMVLNALWVLGLALTGAVYYSQRKARMARQRFWTSTTRRLLSHLLIPLVTGGIFILILIFRNHLELIIPAMLIFYGLSLVNAGKFTLGEIHYLGMTEIVMGILAAIFPDLGLLIWSIGFGLMHIIYGSVMYYRHER